MQRRRPELTARAWVVTADAPARLLLVRHSHGDGRGSFWCLPGGGVEPGETLAQAAEREVREETGLTVAVTRLLGVIEFLRRDRVEFVFAARVVAGHLTLGQDPEVAVTHLTDVAWIGLADLVHLDDLRPRAFLIDLAAAPATALYSHLDQ